MAETEDNTQDYESRERLWDEQWPSGGPERRHAPSAETDDENEMEAFPEVTGTTDALRSVQEAEPYVPPIDPPVLPGGEEGIHVATGFGLSVEEEGAEAPAPRGDEDLRDMAILTLQQDSLASQFPLHVQVREGVVYLRGQVQSTDDADHAMAVLAELPGVQDVIDETSLDANVG